MNRDLEDESVLYVGPDTMMVCSNDNFHRGPARWVPTAFETTEAALMLV